MNRLALVCLSIVTCSSAACTSQAERNASAVEDRVERQAEANAAAAGEAIAALGMTERQLLDADLVTADGVELGDIAQVRRNAQGAVDGFVVEIENSNPDKFVVIPLAGLTARPDRTGNDLQTTMTAQDLASLPPVRL